MPRILVLDDDPLIAMMMEEWLTELDCETAGPVHNVQSALDLLDGVVLDAAILDVTLANGDCYPVAEALDDRGIPFAFATGHGPEGVDRRFRNALVLSKPFSFENVKHVIGKLLGKPTTI
jgi:CheY-like chemotaxis protein